LAEANDAVLVTADRSSPPQQIARSSSSIRHN
jgi:hypothetical protein